MREFANIATRDTQGIQLPGHLKVTQTGSPSGNVSATAGGVIIRNSNNIGQSYIGRVTSDTLVPIPPTSGSSQSYLIFAYIRDPDFSPWQPYTDPNQIKFGPYFFVDKVACSGSTTKASQVVSYSAVELARVDMPPSTTNITDAMIHDLRSLAQPRVGFAQAVQAGPASDFLTIGQTTWRNFPTNSLAVTVPPWATNCLASIRLNQIQTDGPSDFLSAINLGGIRGISSNYDYNGNPGTSVGFVEGIPMELYADIDVRTLQGQTVTCYPEAERTWTMNTGNIYFNNHQQVVFDLRFIEKAI